jgi:PAS domain S-box-containing protein
MAESSPPPHLKPMPPTASPDAHAMPLLLHPPATVSPGTSLLSVVQGMERCRSSCVVVVHEQRPVGIFTERDVVKLIAAQQPLTDLPIDSIMTRQVITLPLAEITDVATAFHRMQHHCVRHLPVVDAQGLLVGIITTRSLRESLKPSDLLKLRRVSDVMLRHVVQASVNHSLLQVVQLMASAKTSCVVIVQPNSLGDKIPIGIVTERDTVLLHNREIDPASTPIAQVMTQPLILLRSTDTLMQVYELMQQHQVRRLVTAGNRGELVGLVTQTHILQTIDPVDAYSLIQVLQEEVQHLQAENITLLEQSNRALEQQVQERIQQLQEQDRYEHLLTRTALSIHQSSQLDEILETTVTELRRILQCDRTVVYQCQPEGQNCVVGESVAEPIFSLVGHCTLTDPLQSEQFWNSTDALSHVQVLADCATHPNLSQQQRQQWAEIQVQASLSVPIIEGDRRWGWLMAHQCQAPRHWRDSEVEFLAQLGIQVSIAIQQATLVERLRAELAERQQAETALQRLNAELEQRVADRTVELTTAYHTLQTELQERIRTEQALQISEASYRRIVETANEGIWVIDANDITTFANPKMAEMLGYTPDEMIGSSLFQFMDAETALIAQQSLRLRRQGRSEVHDFKFQRKDGSPLWGLLSATSILDSEGHYLGSLGMVADITERRQLEQMKAEFIAMVSHELRTPLTSMQAGLSLLHQNLLAPASEAGKAVIEIATEEVDRLVKLVNEILDLERLESGKIRLGKQTCNTTRLATRAIEHMQTLANQRGIQLIRSVADWLDTDIEVDGDRILQVFINLISNSLKFSSPGTTIQLTAKPLSSDVLQVCFGVQDQGQGIPPEHLDLIFERFHQVDASNARQQSGTGLGLAICQRIVESHGGKIWAESNLKQGSCFYFTLPAANSAKGAAPPQATSKVENLA